MEDRYLRYLASRVAHFRNVWWSFANEWDLMDHKTINDWERYARVIGESDPCKHLRGIHKCRRNYNHHADWITHVSYQGHPNRVRALRVGG